MQICYDQPQSEAQLRAEPVFPRSSTTYSKSQHVSQWVAGSRDFAIRTSSRASLHTLSRPRKSHSRPRPSIGLPSEFRHTNGVDGIQSMLDDAPMPVRRRRSFTPLELSIYLPDGRLSPLPDFTVVELEKLPGDLERPAHAVTRDSRTNSISSHSSSHLIQRKPIGSASRRSSIQSQNSRHSRSASVTLSTLPFLQEEPKSRPESFISIPPSLLRSSTAGSLTSPNRIVSHMPSPSRSRTNIAPSRPASLRRAKTDVDEAIRELNTIVEERRASAYRSNNQSLAFINRPPPSPSHHVPRVAPSLRMHVREETLSDIGSAFSVPLASKPLPTLPSTKPPSRAPIKLSLFTSASERSYTGPLTSNPITPPTPTVPTPTTPMHRLGAWIKRSMPTTPTNPTLFKSSASTTSTISVQKPFYQLDAPVPSSARTSTSRPSSASSRTLTHTRQASNETATVTLFSTSSVSTRSSTPALSIRSLSPVTITAPTTPPRTNLLKGQGKTRRVPKPLNLAREKEMMVEAAMTSARSVRSLNSLRNSKPPPSPHYGLLRGMEMAMPASDSVRESYPPMSAVGLAF
jgi:hypothetical protein